MRTEFAVRNHNSDNPRAHFFLLVPALREVNVITDTLTALRRFDYPAERVDIVVALDAKECGETTTANVVADYVDGCDAGPRVTTVTFHGDEQRRSLQLNAGLAEVRDQVCRRRIAGPVVVGVYDADSRPDPRALAYVDWRLRTTGREKIAFQQTVSYLSNVDRLRGAPLVHANAVYQSVWNLLFETPRLLASQRSAEHDRPLLFPPYCMGHGEFFSLAALDAIGGFPLAGPCDGIQAGFALSRIGIPIVPVPFDDTCESPTTKRTIVGQHTFWYSGNLEFFAWYRPAWDARVVAANVCHLVLNLKWLLRPVWFGAILAVLSYRRRGVAAGALALSPIVYYRVVTALWRWANDGTSIPTSDLPMDWVPAAAALKSVGAANALFRICRGRSTFHKTER